MPRRNINGDRAPAAVNRVIQQLGARIATARIRRGLRQEDLARRAGMSKVTLSRLEQGQLGTGIGAYAGALWAMGLHEDLAGVADPDRDEEGKALESARRPDRIRPSSDLSRDF